MTAHAKLRPPSAAARWLSCAASVTVVPLYPNDESERSLKGTRGHTWLENGLIFGIRPDTGDATQDEQLDDALDWIRKRRNSYGEQCQLYAEQVYDIPETGEFGTADVTFVSPSVLEIADYKDGFVPVDVRLNAQLMLYLCGAIAKYGTRNKYRITVIQPNYDHIDGIYRTYEVTDDELDWFRKEVEHAMQSTEFVAGKHCKKSYCPHRGPCQTFNAWAEHNIQKAWFTSEINAITDDDLRDALDLADVYQGMRDELRKEAMRRIMNMDRQVPGYKVTKGKRDRDFRGDNAKAQVFTVAREMGASEDDLYEKKAVSVKGIEDYVKTYCRKAGLPNGSWKTLWDNQIAPHVLEYAGGLTLVRDIDGRPAHKRGNEFGPLPAANPLAGLIV